MHLREFGERLLGNAPPLGLGFQPVNECVHAHTLPYPTNLCVAMRLA